MSIQAITSSQNQLIKLASSLDSKSGRKKSNCFLLEGEKIIAEAIKNKVAIDFVLVLEKSQPAILKDLDTKEIYQVDEKLMKKACSTESLVEILAVAKQDSWQAREQQSQISLYCENIQDPGNLGSIIRSAMAAGANEILLSPNCADIYNPKTIRSTKGTLFYADIKTNIDIESVKNSGASLIGSSLKANKNYYDLEQMLEPGQKIVLLAGNEANGLSAEAEASCKHLIKIPMANGIESLNVTAATSILLFELARIVQAK